MARSSVPRRTGLPTSRRRAPATSSFRYAAPLARSLDADAGSVGVGARVGPFRVLRELGHGGMGTVWLAERDDEFHQQVALKLVRGALAFEDHLVRRFREKRQILASLDHPGIAHLIDGGVTAEKLPWFAMERVEGIPLDRYARERDLPLKARLSCFGTRVSSPRQSAR